MNFTEDMRLGISIGNTLDSFSDDVELGISEETLWGNPAITQKFVDALLSQGIRLIRIPVTWRKHIGSAPEYKIYEPWLDRVQEVIDYVYQRGAYVILNIHHEDWNEPYYDNQEEAMKKMKAVWSQIAERFMDYGDRLIFEGQNEPRKTGTEIEWTGGDQEGWDVVNAMNQVFVNTIRSFGGNHATRYLMIPGYGANCTVGIRHVEFPEDKYLILSVHAYEPYDFALNTKGRADWQEDTKVIDELMEELDKRFLSKGIPVIIGEFGAMNKDNIEERAKWAKYYTTAATRVGAVCVWWDNGLFTGEGERFGLFDRNTGECLYPEILSAMLTGTEK